MVSPLTLAIPLGGLAALLSWAFGEGTAGASENPKERKLTREEWEADKQGWYSAFGDSLNCQPGYKVVWDEYDGSRAHFNCVKLPTVDKVSVAPATPGEQPKTVVTPTAAIPGPAVIPAPAPPHNAPITVPTANGPQVVIPISKPTEARAPLAVSIKSPKASEKPAVVSIMEQKQKEASKETSRDEKTSTIKEVKKKSVSLADWQADMKKKQKNNNCAPGMSPKFDNFNGSWAEYHCEKSDEPASVVKILQSKDAAHSKDSVLDPYANAAKDLLPLAKLPNGRTVAKVSSAPFEPEAAPFVEEALKSGDYNKILDSADSIAQQWPRAAAFLNQQASKYKPSSTVTTSHKMDKPADVVSILKSKDKEAAKEVAKTAKEEKPKEQSPSVSKSDWEKDKAKKAKSSNCRTGYEPRFTAYAGGWAEYKCVPTEKLAHQMDVLSAEGLEPEVSEQVAFFIYNQPTASQARNYADEFKKHPNAKRILNQYASNMDAIAAAKAPKKTAPATSKPTDIATLLDADEAKKMGKRVNETDDLSELKAIGDTFRAAGYSKEAKAVDARMSSLLSSPKQKDASSKDSSSKVETKTVKTATGDKTLPVVTTASDKKAAEDKKLADKKKEAKQKDEQNNAKKAADDAKKATDTEKAKQVAADLKKQLDKTTDQQILPELDDEKPGDRSGGKKKPKVSGDVDSDGVSSPYSTGAFEISSPIDGVSDDAWLAFVRAMKSGKPSAVTDSYSLGMFGFGARRLVDYGLMTNPRQVSYRGNTVWSGDWVSPMELRKFLTDAPLQYRLFEEDMLNKAQYVEESGAIGADIDGQEATMSGLLAVAFKTTESSFHRWLDASHEERMMFPPTMDLFERANGIF